MSEVRTRIAPSPTGGLHIGHMRTILFDYALAKKNNGKFLIRIEDTDQKRYVEGAVELLLKVVSEYGFTWDEGPDKGGPFAPYVQSERLELYKKYAEQLVSQDDAYYCFLNEEETKELQEQLRLENKKFRSPYRNYSKEQIQELLDQKKPYVIRLKVKEGMELSFEDAVLGKVNFNTTEVDDQVLLKTDGFPTYHLAVVIDDHLMEISHVLRGNDWLPSTPKHILLYKAFGWEIPVIAHLPNLKEKDSGKKLSKRFGAVFAIQFLEMGYLPEALLNFLMLLGWSSPEERVFGEKEKELYSLEEFTNLFSLDRVQKTALVSFDREKLKWFNQQYLKKLSSDELFEQFMNWIHKYVFTRSESPTFAVDENKDMYLTFADYIEENIGDEALKDVVQKALPLVQERSATFMEILESIYFFENAPKNIDWNIKQTEAYRDRVNLVLEKIKTLFENMDREASNWKQDVWVEEMKKINTEFNLKGGDSFMVLRIAVVGGPFSPPLYEALQILGKEEILNRIKNSQS